MKTTRVGLLLAALLAASVGPALGLGLLLPERWSTNGAMPPPRLEDLELMVVPPAEMTPLEISDQTVDVTIKDQVTRTKVDQQFQNNTGRIMEGTFLFPLPAGSTISDFALYIDGKRQPGEMLEAQKAKEIYEGIVRRRQDPALLEYVGENLFKARVFPIPGNGSRRIDMTYEQILKLDGGMTQYTYPLRAPRSLGKPIKNFTLTLTLESQRPIKTIYSPSHNVSIKREGDNKVKVSYEGTNQALDRDFTLIYSVDEKSFGCSLLTHRPDADEDGYFMLLLTPKQKTDESEIIPKDVTFVCDTSGSMNGEKMEQAKRALLFCVNSLNKADRFNVIGFATEVDPLFPALLEATDENVKKARKFITNRLRAAGGTAINDALLEALKHKPADGRPCMVVFATDGTPTVGPRDPEAIVGNVKAAMVAGTRVFCLGVGNELNTKLLDRLSGSYGGVSEYVRPEEDIEVKVSSFYAKIASPVMADLKLDFGTIQVTEMYPKTLPDLFKGSQVEVVGRYRNDGNIALKLSGRVGLKRVELAYDAEFPKEDESNEFLQRIWAQRKVAYLMDEIRLNGENPELREEIVRLGKQYCIQTPYTSFLVVEDTQVAVQPEPDFRRRLSAPDEERSWREGVRPAPPVPGQAFEPSDTLGGDDGGGRAAGASAPAPTLQAMDKLGRLDMSADTGANAVQAAKTLGEAKSSSVVAGRSSGAVQTVGARTFYQKAGAWVDSEFKDGMETLAVKYGSDAYFAVSAALKQLGPCLGLGKDVVVVYKGKALKISEAAGQERLTADEVKAFFAKTK